MGPGAQKATSELVYSGKIALYIMLQWWLPDSLNFEIDSLQHIH